eukprot:m.35965 g.35965  ORF g.35965 m.35965 type:complete len:358 (+) comp17228_c1_seq1:170-1243(+)
MVGVCPACARMFRPRSQNAEDTVKAIKAHMKAMGNNGCQVHAAVSLATTQRQCPACVTRFVSREHAWEHLLDAWGEPNHARFRTQARQGRGPDARAMVVVDPVRIQERLLYAACQNGEHNVVRHYLDHGVSPNNGGEDGWTPLMAAASKGLGMFVHDAEDGHAKCVRMLANHPECTTLNAKNIYGQSALSFAAQEGHLGAVLELLDASGTLALEDTSKSRLTAAETARAAGFNEIANILAERTHQRQIDLLTTALTTGAASGPMDSISARIRALYDAAELDFDIRSQASTDTQGDLDRFDGVGATCAVCLNAAVEAAFVPCYHAQACSSCANEVMRNAGGCPICRQDVTSVQRIFLS